MLVDLIGKEGIHKIVLPKTPIGNYWLCDNTEDTKKNLINIEGKNGNWQIITNKDVQVINPRALVIENDNIKITPETEVVTDRIILKEYNLYGICIGSIENFYIVYCSPTYENNYSQLRIRNTGEIFIGKSEKNHIVYNNKLVSNTHARIIFDNKSWVLENFDKKFGTYVNNEIVTNETKKLENGDVIFIMGLKIIILGNSIYINNPLSSMTYNKKFLVAVNISREINETEGKKEDENLEIYSEDDYFSRSPRLINVIEKEKVKIDPPPAIQSDEHTPLALVLGSSMSMGIVMLVSATRTIDNFANGKGTNKELIFQIIVIVAMLFSMLFIPILNVKYDKKRKKKREEKRQQRYRKYIDSKIEILDEMMEKQRSILYQNNLSQDECVKIILNKETRLWERKKEDSDFLNIRLGIGDVPLEIDINYPEDRFMMEDDNLVDILNTILLKSKIIKSAPISFSLLDKKNYAFISKNQEELNTYMKSIILQLITFQSYEDLKLVFLLGEDKNKNWEYVKLLPHIWSTKKDIRYFADNYSDMERISNYLENIFNQRLGKTKSEKETNYKAFPQYYLIITDDYKKIGDLRIINKILKEKQNLGFGIVCLTNDLTQLPNEVQTFIELNNKEGKIYESEITSKTQKKFIYNIYDDIPFDKVSRQLFNIPIRHMSNANTSANLPDSYSFLEMYDVGLIEQLNILERWKRNDSTLTLQAPIGVDGTNRIIYLDIHEKSHGPHGLIAGSTGSGKSELIITYILSLAINYHPDDIAFILIDYKGGGLAGAFKKREIVLPHLVGTITNIDTAGLQRSLASIQSELRRRQIVFNEVRNMTEEGTIDIYKYQKLYHDGFVKEPMPHLLIICDEFAELKQQQPEFMDELISVSRIGRSLGVHLILSTQKPAGIVNDQIRSNSRFAICLKVQSSSDSSDVIGTPNAVNLKGQGQFYIQVGGNEYYNLGQSAWTGAQYLPSDTTKKTIDTSIQFISNTGNVIKSVEDNSIIKKVRNDGEQLTRILQYIYELSKKEKIQTKQLWLESIPENIYIEDIRNKYKVTEEINIINPVVGEYDDPSNQRQGVVRFNMSKNGNMVIYGNADSGKETLLSTMIYDIICTHDTNDVQIYILDFGSESLKIFKDSPQVGDVAFINENEKIFRLFDMIDQEINKRKNILSNYNGDYEWYLESSGKSMPIIMIILNNYDIFMETYESEFYDRFSAITRDCIKFGIVFVVTTNAVNSLRYRLTQNFNQKVVLQLNNDSDYVSVFDRVRKKRPSKLFGRGLISIEEEIYEFQTAKISDAKDYNSVIREKISELNEMMEGKNRAQEIPILPDVVTIKYLQKDLKRISSVPLGIVEKDLRVFNYNFVRNFITILTSKNLADVFEYAGYLVDEIKKLKDVEIFVFDMINMTNNSLRTVSEEYLKFISKTSNLTKEKHILCVILGMDKFINDIIEEKALFNQRMEYLKQTGCCSFLIVDNYLKIKDHSYDEWYKNYTAGDNGIWIGGGIENQYIISVNASRREIDNNCPRNFGYVIRGGRPTFIKLLNMKEEEFEEDDDK